MDKDIEILQDWITRDREMRNNSTQSDYDKFCEEKCEAIEHIICENAQYSEHNRKLEQALIDTDRIAKEYKKAYENYHKSVCVFEVEEDYSNIFETKEDAEFASKYQNILRIDYLNLPTYEEFIKNHQSFGDELITDEKCMMFNCKDGVYSLYAYDNEIWVGKDADGSVMFHKKLNKENYIEACDICVKLFKGEM